MRKPRRAALAFSVLLILLGNGKALWMSDSRAGSLGGVLFGLLVACGSLVYGRSVAQLTWTELGLARTRAIGQSVGVGLVVVAGPAALLVLAVQACRRLGLPVPVPVSPLWLRDLPEVALWRRIFVYLPWVPVLPEELAFRGARLGTLIKQQESRLSAAALATSVFVLWHVTLAWQEAPRHDPVQLALRFGGYAIGGLLFAVPRLATNHLAGSLAAHWLANTLLMSAGHHATSLLKAPSTGGVSGF